MLYAAAKCHNPLFENEKIICQIVGISEVCDQNDDRVL